LALQFRFTSAMTSMLPLAKRLREIKGVGAPRYSTLALNAISRHTLLQDFSPAIH
jgi:hypothetical protein